MRGRDLVWMFAFAASCNAVAGLNDLAFDGEAGQGGQEEGGAAATPKQPIGTPCEDNAECASGSCSDGVCCDQACVGECVTCAVLNAYGTCLPMTGSPCQGGVCDSLGQCAVLDGATCNSAADCLEAPACVDGVCCNEVCDGTCESCVMSETGFPDGLCAPAQEGADECGGNGCVSQDQCCGEPAAESGDGCPPDCTGGCQDGTCIIICDEQEECQSGNIVCPPGLACEVRCSARHACRNAAIDCPADHACSVQCLGNDGHHECEDATITCTNGPCAVACNGPEPCRFASIVCGTNACDVTCTGTALPTVECGAACRCTPC